MGTDTDFTDEQFMSAKDKALVLRAWERFLRRGLRLEDFSDRLYKHLSLHCAFIAHYNRQGFFDVYFGANHDATLRFLGQFDPDGSMAAVEGGGRWWLAAPTGADLNWEMTIVARPHLPELRAKLVESRLAAAEAAAEQATERVRRLRAKAPA